MFQVLGFPGAFLAEWAQALTTPSTCRITIYTQSKPNLPAAAANEGKGDEESTEAAPAAEALGPFDPLDTDDLQASLLIDAEFLWGVDRQQLSQHLVSCYCSWRGACSMPATWPPIVRGTTLSVL